MSRQPELHVALYCVFACVIYFALGRFPLTAVVAFCITIIAVGNCVTAQHSETASSLVYAAWFAVTAVWPATLLGPFAGVGFAPILTFQSAAYFLFACVIYFAFARVAFPLTAVCAFCNTIGFVGNCVTAQHSATVRLLVYNTAWFALTAVIPATLLQPFTVVGLAPIAFRSGTDKHSILHFHHRFTAEPIDAVATVEVIVGATHLASLAQRGTRIIFFTLREDTSGLTVYEQYE